jgi:outer membrane protein TolC
LKKPVKRIAFVLDGPEINTKGFVELFETELRQLLQGDFRVVFPKDLVRQADFTADGVRRVLDETIRNTNTDLVIALGPLSSREACRMKNLPKPVIAAMIIDHEYQKVPYAKGTSGVRNLTYIEMPDTFKEDLLTFAQIVPFHSLALLGGPSLFAALPDAEEGRDFRIPFIDAHMRLLQTRPSVDQTLTSVPPDVDAVYLLPIPEMSLDDHEKLLRGLALRRLPVFSLIGHAYVRRGALAGLNKADWPHRFARRTALNARKILAGQDAGTLPVAISREAQLMINMQTASIIGIYPGFKVLTDAIQINVEPDETTRELTLLGVMDEAVLVSLDLAAAGRTNAAGEERVSQARSRLYPQLSARAAGTLIDEDRGESIMAPAEQTLTGSLNLTQVIWSDDMLSNLTITKMHQLRQTLEWEKTRLDVALEAANGYLNVMLAKTRQEILLANFKLSRSNLERAKMRRSLGAASASEVYRLESRIAQERADLLQAQARRKIAEMELNRLLAYSLEQSFKLAEVSLDDQVSLLLSPQIMAYAQNWQGLNRLKQFLVNKGLRASPELMQIDADIAAVKRQLLNAKRSFYAPDINLSGEVSHLIGEGGEGADTTIAGAPDDTDWNVSLNLSIPLWEGGARFAESKESRETLKSLRLQRRAALQRIEQRIRNAVHKAGASYYAIDLLKKASKASRKNFDLVADAYSRGTVPLIDLLDAQTTYLQTEQNAANANYEFLLDLMELERSLGQFTFFLPREQRDTWIQELQAYFKAIDHKEN